MKRTMFITMLAATLLGAQGRAADEIPTSITGYTHTQEDFPHLLYYGKYSESGDVTGGSVGIQADESAEDQYNSEVYGGFSASGSASANNVTIDSGRVLKIYGGQSYEEYVSGNTVTMNGGRVDSWLYGGYSNKGEVNGNSVTMNGGDPWKVVGGYSIYGDSVGNSISAIGVTPSSSYTTIYGGESSDGNAKGNKVSVLESKFYWVEGGMSLYRHAQDNTVTITDSQIDTVYGGYAYGGQPYGGEPGGDSTGNTVIIEGSQITSLICGGSAGIGEAGGNTVTITDSLISGSVDGAGANEGDATDNKVTITDSQMQLAEESHILGGYATSRDATGNSVTITGTEFLGDYLPEVLGGQAVTGNAGGNSVDMTGGHVTNVYGGQGLASANENKVTLTDTQVTGQLMDSGGRAALVYGGASDEGDANGNSVILTGIQLGEPLEEQLQVSLFGFFGGSADIGEGNANGNTVTLTNEKSVDSIIAQIGGGAAFNANNNAVNIIGSGSSSLWDTEIWDVYGGYAGANNDSNANGNTVYIKDRHSILDVYGGVGYNTANNTVVLENCVVFVVKGSESNGGKNCGNSVDITGGHVITNVYGGLGLASANENKVNLTNAQVDGYVSGGTSDEGDAKGNVVTITDSQIEKACGGIAAGEGDASDNIVTITGSLIAGEVEGARAADASGNKVTITDSQMQLAEGSHILGGYATSRDATGNSVTITGTEFLGDYLPEVLGGHADAGNANGNSVDMTGGHVSSVYGGRGLASANENKVNLTNAHVDEYVYGGQSDEGDANGNSVTLAEIQVGRGKSWLMGVYGGFAAQEASGNTVSLSGDIGNYLILVIYGGHGSNANNNAVNITSPTTQNQGYRIGVVYGGCAGTNNDTNASGNTVSIKGRELSGVFGGVGYNTTNNTVVLEDCDYAGVVLGSDSYGGKNYGNMVTMNGGQAFRVTGGQGLASANENKVNLTDAQVDDYVYGGKSDEGDANGNTVTVTNSQVGVIAAAEGYNTVGNTAVMSGGKADSIGGGLSNGGENSGNTVIVTEGVVQYGIIGGHLWNGGELRDNRVYLVGKGATATIGGQQYTGGSSGIQAGSIAAAYALEDGVGEPADLISGNAIDVYGTDITAGRMYGMQILNFHIMEGLANFEEAAMVSITGTVESDRLDLTSVQLGFYAEGVEDWSAFAGKSVTLVEAAQEILGVDSGTQVDIMIGDRVVGAAALVLGSGNKTLSLENIVFVPEPATGTLGLLALAALAARRRKNQSTK